mgnify:FL=1
MKNGKAAFLTKEVGNLEAIGMKVLYLFYFT